MAETQDDREAHTGDDRRVRSTAKGDPDGENQRRPDDDEDKAKDESPNSADQEKKTPEIFKKPWFIALLCVAGAVVLGVLVLYYIRFETYGRFQQTTNDAYLDADQASIASRVSGYVADVLVADNQNIKAAQPLVRIVADNYEASADKDKAQIAQAQAKVAEVQAQMIQQEAKVALTRAELAQDRSDRTNTAASATFNRAQVSRYEPLAATGAESREKLAQYRSEAEQTDAQLRSAGDKIASGGANLLYEQRQVGVYQAQLVSALAQVQQGRAQLSADRVDLASTDISSRIDGRVGDREVRVGQYVQAGTRLMTVVPVNGIYLRANFKETQIGLMRVGQPVTIKVDALKGAVLQGVVDSFSPGTGAQFALAPKDNSTGNFTKIVQRVPVKIRLVAGEEARKVLVPGLSAVAVIDTTGAKVDERALKSESKRQYRQRLNDKQAEDRQQRQDHEQGAGHE